MSDQFTPRIQVIADILKEMGFTFSRGVFKRNYGQPDLPTLVITRTGDPEWPGIWIIEHETNGALYMDALVLQFAGEAIDEWDKYWSDVHGPF